LYAIAGFVLAPRLVRSALLKDIPQSIGVTPEVGEIRINPFLFQVTIDKFSLGARGGEKLPRYGTLLIHSPTSISSHPTSTRPWPRTVR